MLSDNQIVYDSLTSDGNGGIFSVHILLQLHIFSLLIYRMEMPIS